MIAVLVYVIGAAIVLAALLAVAVVLLLLVTHQESGMYEDTDWIFDCLERDEVHARRAVSERARRVLAEKEKEMF